MTAKQHLFSPIFQSFQDVSKRIASDARDGEESEALGTILNEARRFCRTHVNSAVIDKRGALGRELLDAVAECGLFGLTIPDSFGGAGISMKAATRVVAEICSFDGSLGTCVGLHSGLALYGLIHLARPETMDRYLPEIASGKRIASFAATEPNAGSDLGAIRTCLTEVDGKLRLNGSKCYVTNGGFCGIMTVLASSPGLGGARSGHTLVVVDPSWTGVSRQGEENKLGLKGSSTITIDFDDVEVPHDHVLGEVSKGMDLAHVALTWGRTFMAAGCLGSARGALAEAKAHTAERVQFGRPLRKFPLVRLQTAGCMADLYAAESIIRLVCDLFDSRLGDIALPSTVAKVFVSETAWNAIDRSVQLMGGVGFIEDAGVARRLRDIRVTRIFEGANDVLRLHLASATLGWDPTDMLALPPIEPLVPAVLAPSAHDFDGLMADLAKKIVGIRKKLGFKLFERQALQVAMADCVIPVYSMAAVLLRAAGELQAQGDANQDLALLASERLARSARSALSYLDQYIDDPMLALAERLIARED